MPEVIKTKQEVTLDKQTKKKVAKIHKRRQEFSGSKIERRFTKKGQSPLDIIEYENRSCKIVNPDGTTVFEMENIEVPKTWSKVASDILISKYIRKDGVPQVDKFGNKILDKEGKAKIGSEKTSKQVFMRLAGCWRHWGEKYNYFASKGDAQTFEDEVLFMLANQYGAPNSPQWFNTGLNFAYQITGPAQGHWYTDPDSGELKQSEDAYSHPQPHACQPYNALISTPSGPIPIGEIVEKKMIGLEVYDGSSITKIKAVKKNGIKEVHRIILKNNNQIEVTADHLVEALQTRRTEPKWFEAKELKPGMRVRQRCETNIRSRKRNSREISEAALAGWLQGDGFVGQYNHKTSSSLIMEYMTVNEEEHDFVMGHIANVLPNVHYHIREVASQDKSLSIKRIRFYGEKLRSFVEDYELNQNTQAMRIPRKILSGGAQSAGIYLKALYQADGCVRIRLRQNSSSADIVLTTISQSLASDVLSLLSNMGIYARINTCKDSRSNRLPTYQVIIAYETERKKFMSLVGFVSSNKNSKLNKSLVKIKGKNLPAIREEEIIKIEKIGKMEVYDIETESHQYLSNNVIVHNCFIQSVNDNLVNEGGIFDLVTREARIFKYGSGSGTNFSALRSKGESLSGGGSSTGLMSWLEIFDKAAGAIKSGGTTRRAAKMVVLNADHPEIEEFIMWKHREEQKAAALIAEGYSAGLEGEAIQSVSGQNSNNTVRVTDDFMKVVKEDGDWHLRARVNYDRIIKTVKAKKIWDMIADSTWHCGDPGLQFDTTINAWHTCLASGRINASNPCSEFMFLDDSSCNLASLNLVKFLDSEGNFDVKSFEHATRIWTIVLEISVLMAQFPSNSIAKNSYLYRPLGLGFANLGALLMVKGLPYDSEEGRGLAAGITSLMTGVAYATSAEMAKNIGTFEKYEENKDDMLRVIRNHRRATNDVDDEEYEKLEILPYSLKREAVPDDLLESAREAWDKALLDGGQYGFRNAQVTLLAPTGTIGLLMDCDTTGIEPDYALVKFKKLAGGGYFKIINQSVPAALTNLGYSKAQIDEIIRYIVGSDSLENTPHINRASLSKKGLSEEDIAKIEKSVPGAFEISQAFTKDKVSAESYKKLSLEDAAAKDDFDLLSALGFSKDQINEASEYICGLMTIEGAPNLKEDHLPVFDCANRCGAEGKRFIAPEGHIKMMAATQPFLSGAISKTVNVPGEATKEDIEKIYMEAWKLGLKAIAIYRDGSKLTQPLNSTKDAKREEKKPEKEIVIEYRPIRKRLAKQRTSITRKVVIGGHKMFLTVGLYEDNKPGELFIIMNQQGSFAAGMADSFAKMVSVGLQYGVPIETIVSQLRHMRFQPMGFTGDSDISNASSLPDFIAQWFEKMFLTGGLKAMELPFVGDRIEDKEDAKAQSKLAQKAAEDIEEEERKIKSGSLFADGMGFSGEMCPECGLATMVLNGHCYKCVNCGATTGCS